GGAGCGSRELALDGGHELRVEQEVGSRQRQAAGCEDHRTQAGRAGRSLGELAGVRRDAFWHDRDVRVDGGHRLTEVAEVGRADAAGLERLLDRLTQRLEVMTETPRDG